VSKHNQDGALQNTTFRRYQIQTIFLHPTLRTSQTGLGTHPISYPVTAGGDLSPWAKRQGQEAEYSSMSNAEIEKGEVISPLVHMYVFLAWCLIKHRNNSFILIHGAEPFLRRRHLYSHYRTSQHFMEPESSILCPQEP
jgi:hypothetical protein